MNIGIIKKLGHLEKEADMNIVSIKKLGHRLEKAGKCECC